MENGKYGSFSGPDNVGGDITTNEIKESPNLGFPGSRQQGWRHLRNARLSAAEF